MNVHAVLHIPTLHGKIFIGIFPMWKCAKLLPSKQTKSNLTFKIYCPNFGGNYNAFKFLGKVFTASSKQIESKLTNYLLNKSHPVGGSKAEWFEQALGFNQSNMKDLAKQIKFDPKTAVLQKNNGFGNLYQTVNTIKGANGKSVNVRFNWISREGEKKAELVGALPTKK